MVQRSQSLHQKGDYEKYMCPEGGEAKGIVVLVQMLVLQSSSASSSSDGKASLGAAVELFAQAGGQT